MNDMDKLINELSNDFTKIIHIDDIKTTPLYWGGNGIGDRFANKKFNYSVVYKNGKCKTYSENENDSIEDEKLKEFIAGEKGVGIKGIYVHSKRTNVVKRPISKEIDKKIKESCCVNCGSTSDIICDHKNDLYNDKRVLKIETQELDDFQALCNHCNLQKRQICKKENETQKIYSIKNIPKFKILYNFEIPWEKKIFDINNKLTKLDTYWYDPMEFIRKLFFYKDFIIPLHKELLLRNF